RNLSILVRTLTWCVAFNAILSWLRPCGPSIGATTTHVTFGIARNAAPVFRPRSPLPTIPTLSRSAAIILGFAQQLRQLGNIRRDTPRLILREQLGGRTPARIMPPVGVRLLRAPEPRQSLASSLAAFGDRGSGLESDAPPGDRL